MHALFIHYAQNTVFLTLKNNEKTIASKNCEGKAVGKYFMILVQELASMAKHNVIDAFFVNIGPCPIFTQRSILAAVNGIVCGARLAQKNIQLFGIDGFLYVYDNYRSNNPKKITIALSNAYGNDVFYLYTSDNTIKSGIATMSEIQIFLRTYYTENLLYIIGDITETQQIMLKDTFKEKIIITDIKNLTTEEFITFASSRRYQEESMPYILPLYSKLHAVEK